MSIRPISANSDGTFTIVHDGTDHKGDVSTADIKFSAGVDRTDNKDFLIINCPQCDSSSTHPVGGGSDPVEIQALFTHVYIDRGCPCGQLTSGKPEIVVKAHAKKHAENMDGRGRWKLDGVGIW